MPRRTDEYKPPRVHSLEKADYQAGKLTRFVRRRTGIVTTGSGADYHYRTESHYLRAMEYARDMARNDTIVGPLLDRSAYNVLQGGFTHDFQTGDESVDRLLWQRLEDWKTDPRQCDDSGRFTFDALVELAYRAHLVDGDVFALPLKSGALQLIEAHRCRTPSNTKRNVVHGIMLSERRQPVEYWFTKDNLDPQAALDKVSDITRYPAVDTGGNPLVFHLYDPQRFTQTRGFTAFAPVFDALGMFEDINFAKLVQAQIVSCFAILRTRQPTPPHVASSGQYGGRETETMSDGTSRVVEGVSPGMEVAAAPGETLQGFSPNVPNSEYFEHAKLTLQLICAQLNVPLISLLLDGSETNFSGWRGAIDQAKQGWRRTQKFLRQTLYVPVTRWKVRQWLDEDRALRRLYDAGQVDPFNVLWRAPRWPYIEPEKDIRAQSLELESGLTSPRRSAAARGEEYDEILAERIEDNAAAIRAALEATARIAARHGVRVDPTQLLYLDPSKPLILEDGNVEQPDTDQDA